MTHLHVPHPEKLFEVMQIPRPTSPRVGNRFESERAQNLAVDKTERFLVDELKRLGRYDHALSLKVLKTSQLTNTAVAYLRSHSFEAWREQGLGTEVPHRSPGAEPW